MLCIEPEEVGLLPKHDFLHPNKCVHKQKGKLDELNFILSGGGMGGLPTYAQDFYQDEPWVEFIEVDAEDADTGEKEENQGSDTQRLLGLCHPASHHMNTGCSNGVRYCTHSAVNAVFTYFQMALHMYILSLFPPFPLASSFPDDDSGRASCYDPDLPEQDPLMLMATLLSSQTEDVETSFNVVERAPAPERGERPLVQTQTGGPQTWVNTDFYAQVSNVMPSGGVVLSPGQQLRIQESTSATEEEMQKGKSSEDTEDKRQKELQFQMLMVDPEGSGYTTESIARQISTPPAPPMPGEGYQTIQPQPVETKPAAMAEDNQSPYILPDSSQSQLFAPVADYTVVQEVDNQHSLLLKPPARQSPPPCMPQHPLKALPAMPMGYITPDLLGNLAP